MTNCFPLLSCQSREEEMGSRVWEVQKELDEIQQRSLTGPQVRHHSGALALTFQQEVWAYLHKKT